MAVAVALAVWDGVAGMSVVADAVRTAVRVTVAEGSLVSEAVAVRLGVA